MHHRWGRVKECSQPLKGSAATRGSSLSGHPSDFNELQRHLAERVTLLREERQAISLQKNLIFSLAVITAVAAVVLVLYGLAQALIDAQLDSLEFPELTGLATGLASGAFGWLAKGLLSRQAELDLEEKEEIQIQTLIAYMHSIRGRHLRNRVTAYAAGLLANRVYGCQDKTSTPLCKDTESRS